MSEAPSGQAAREVVWCALSDLYLDTESEMLTQALLRDLAAAPFTLDELDQILWDEVHPVLRANLGCVAGEWTGFDRQWLVEAIAKHLQRPRLLRWLSDRWFRRGMLAQWQHLRAKVMALRAEQPNPARPGPAP